MKAYYDQRAREYDDWYTGEGCYAARARPGWEEERALLIRLLEALPPGRVLDVACGTGYLTRHLKGTVCALDQSAAMLRVAREQAPCAALLRGDALALPFPDQSFDRVLAAHFYGHLLPEERAPFLSEARAVGGELVVVDAGLRGGAPRDEWQDRALADGSRHRVFKRFFSARQLRAELGEAEILHDGYWFVVAAAAPRRDQPLSDSAPQGFGD